MPLCRLLENLCKFNVGKEREIYRECATLVSRHHFKSPCTGTAKISFILYKVKQKNVIL